MECQDKREVSGEGSSQQDLKACWWFKDQSIFVFLPHCYDRI